MALLYCGPGVSGILVPLLALSIMQFGWRETLVIIGIGLWVIAVPLCFVIRDRPSRYGYVPDGEQMTEMSVEIKNSSSSHDGNTSTDSVDAGLTTREAIRTRAF